MSNLRNCNITILLQDLCRYEKVSVSKNVHFSFNVPSSVLAMGLCRIVKLDG